MAQCSHINNQRSMLHVFYFLEECMWDVHFGHSGQKLDIGYISQKDMSIENQNVMTPL